MEQERGGATRFTQGSVESSAKVQVTVVKNEDRPKFEIPSRSPPPFLLEAFKDFFLQLFLIYTELEERLIADQETGLVRYPIKNIRGDFLCHQAGRRGSANALTPEHGVEISKLEVGSHQWHNKRQFFSF